MPVDSPALFVVAGPNGSGKSTLTSSIWLEGNTNLIDPDAIARSLNVVQPARSAIPAARLAIARCKALLAGRLSFTLETTLAGHGAISIMREAKRAGYRTFLVYIALGDPEMHIERVRLRVSQGGHDIPDIDIRRRYSRSLMRAPEALRFADEAVVLDNSVSIQYGCSSLRTGASFGERVRYHSGLGNWTICWNRKHDNGAG